MGAENMSVREMFIEDFVPSDEFLILDVRDGEKYRAGHIAFAKNCPMSDVSDEDLCSLVADTKTVFVLCGGGTKAQHACVRLSQLLPTLDVVHLIGGTRQAQALGWHLITD